MNSVFHVHRRAERHPLFALLVAVAAALLFLFPEIALGEAWTGDHAWDARMRWEYDRSSGGRPDRSLPRHVDRYDRWRGDVRNIDYHWSAPPPPRYQDYRLGDIVGWVGQELSVKFVGTWEQMSGGDVDYDHWFLSLEGTSFGSTQKTYWFRPVRPGTTDLVYRTQRGERYVYHLTIR